mmetsp:Transcript_4564/g.8474  ORF Transcript_4564/g.8474 Transcript_4564/m.8474 type:complete len:208 (-) Transcript_4564:97-720(-)
MIVPPLREIRKNAFARAESSGTGRHVESRSSSLTDSTLILISSASFLSSFSRRSMLNSLFRSTKLQATIVSLEDGESLRTSCCNLSAFLDWTGGVFKDAKTVSGSSWILKVIVLVILSRTSIFKPFLTPGVARSRGVAMADVADEAFPVAAFSFLRRPAPLLSAAFSLLSAASKSDLSLAIRASFSGASWSLGNPRISVSEASALPP